MTGAPLNVFGWQIHQQSPATYTGIAHIAVNVSLDVDRQTQMRSAVWPSLFVQKLRVGLLPSPSVDRSGRESGRLTVARVSLLNFAANRQNPTHAHIQSASMRTRMAGAIFDVFRGCLLFALLCFCCVVCATFAALVRPSDSTRLCALETTEKERRNISVP